MTRDELLASATDGEAFDRALAEYVREHGEGGEPPPTPDVPAATLELFKNLNAQIGELQTQLKAKDAGVDSEELKKLASEVAAAEIEKNKKAIEAENIAKLRSLSKDLEATKNRENEMQRDLHLRDVTDHLRLKANDAFDSDAALREAARTLAKFFKNDNGQMVLVDGPGEEVKRIRDLDGEFLTTSKLLEYLRFGWDNKDVNPPLPIFEKGNHPAYWFRRDDAVPSGFLKTGPGAKPVKKPSQMTPTEKQEWWDGGGTMEQWQKMVKAERASAKSDTVN